MIESSNLQPLPEGWMWTRLGEISELIRGVSYPKAESSKEPKGGYIPILRANNINTELNFNDLVYVPLKRVKNEQLIKAFDVLIAMSSGSKDLVGKAAQAKHDFFGSFGTFCGLVRAVSGLDKKFVGVFFCSPDYRKEISRLSSGININNLRRAHIESMPIPIPPLPEQYRIAAKIEELFTKQDAGVKSLEKMKAQLRLYRQSVLKHAFEGNLTEEWRERHKDELEPASVLLERIKEERKKNVKEKYKELPLLDTSGLAELPEGWEWTKVGEICELINGRAFKPSEWSSSGLPIIRIQNLNNVNADFNYCDFEIEDKYVVNNRNLLFAWSGTPGTSFGAHIWNRGKAVLNQHIFKVEINEGWISKIFYMHLINHNISEYIRKAHGTAGLAHITKNKFENSPISIPSFLEQQKIAEEIERRFSVADDVERTVEQSLKHAERLRRSILKRAFEGKLVLQDPTDEPASALLERIKAAKQNREIEAKSKPNTTKRKRDLVLKQRRFNDYVE